MDIATAKLLLVTLLASFPGIRRDRVAYIEEHAPSILERALLGESAAGVPPGLLLTVAFLESQLGADPRSGGSWGAPIDRLHRGTAGGAGHAARSLRWGFAVCRTWAGAVGHFRCGRCVCPRLVGYEPAFAADRTELVYTRAGVELPASYR